MKALEDAARLIERGQFKNAAIQIQGARWLLAGSLGSEERAKLELGPLEAT